VPWARFVEHASVGSNPFRDALPSGAQVFWPGVHSRVWLALGTPTWFSADQGAGIVFSRDTAIEYANRKRASGELQSSIDNCLMVAQPACRIEARPARELCERKDGPDYVVLNARVNGYPALEWLLPSEIGPGRQSLFLYSCRDLAKNLKGRR